MNKMIYVGSPYSHSNMDVRLKRFEDVSKYCSELVSKGYLAISPITYGHVLTQYKEMPTDFEFWGNFCLGLLKKCDYLYILMLEGWENSLGLIEEIKFAEKNNIEIKYIKCEN